MHEMFLFSRKRLAIPEPRSRVGGRVTTFREGAGDASWCAIADIKRPRV